MDIEKLILSVRNCKVLYSKADKNHKNRLLVMKAWDKVSEEVGVEGKINRLI